MYYLTEVESKIIQRIHEVLPATPPEAVSNVYKTACEYFGEENVDLQPNNSYEYFYHRLFSYESLNELLNYFHISREALGNLRPYSFGNSWSSVFSEHSDTFELFLQALTWKVISSSSFGCYAILIRFRDITVSNEQNISTTIEEIFSLTPVTSGGCTQNRMLWLRTIVSDLHCVCEYEHSHLPRRSRDMAKVFRYPCLGTGPILMTIGTLEEVCDLDLWRLYWLELDRCIRVESLNGGPYMHISNINNSTNITATLKYYKSVSSICKWLPREEVKKLVSTILASKKLKFRWNNGHYEIALCFAEFTVLLSNVYLAMLDQNNNASDSLQQLYQTDCIYRAKITNGIIYVMKKDIGVLACESLSPIEIFTFKGEPVYYQVISSAAAQNQIQYFTLLNNTIVSYIYCILTKLINYGCTKK